MLPVVVDVPRKQKFYVALTPPIGGLKLQVFLDESTRSVASRNTTTQPRYNFTLYLPPGMQGLHNLTADLSDSAGNRLASPQVTFAAVHPLSVAPLQPATPETDTHPAAPLVFMDATAPELA